ncbi:MAG: hypothetical protein IKY91_05560 [Akkermansia sp.]|nr:hypothetical protein [Akkermansia sp.]
MDKRYSGWDGKSHTLRDNLLVTFGCRAGAMYMAGHIHLPAWEQGEDDLAVYADHVVDAYLSIDETEDISFDEHIETALMERYGKET